MAARDPEGTARLFVEYTSAGFAHTMLLRFPSGTLPSDMVTTATPILQEMKGVMRAADGITGLSYSTAGSSVRLPLPFTPLAGERSNDLQEGDAESHYIDFVGRGQLSGAKVRYTIFVSTSDLQPPSKNRYEPGTLGSDMVAIRNALVNATTGTGALLSTIAGDAPAIYAYVNSGWNYHWQAAQRP